MSNSSQIAPEPACAGKAVPTWVRLGACCLLAIPLALTGCGLLRPKRSPAKVEIKSLKIGTNEVTAPMAFEVLQNQVQRFADDYASKVAQSVDDYMAHVNTPEARLAAVRWKLSQARAAYIDATGANPALNVLDLVVLATVSRLVMEDEVDQLFGPEGQPILEMHRKLEAEVWNAVSRVIKPERQQELRSLIDEWRRKNPNQRYVSATRLRELATLLGKAPQASTTAPSSVLSLLFLDPLAGLDPTAEAIQETRQLAERAMYYSQRMPTLLNWQVQMLAYEMADQPEFRQVLTNTEQLTRSTEAFSQLADQMPKLVNDQREAAIQQVLAGLAAERTNWLNSLAAEEQKAHSLLAETRQTLDAGSQMAASLNLTIQSLDQFVRYVSPPATNPGPATANQRPFDVLDVGTAANQVGAMAQNLQSLLAEANQSAPRAAQLGQQTRAEAEQVLNRAFWVGAALILIFLAGSVLAGMTYRALANKFQPAVSSLQLAALHSEPHPQHTQMPNP